MPVSQTVGILLASDHESLRRMSDTLHYPKGIAYIIATEAAERFSYYGMRSILTVFLVSQFFNSGHDPALQATAEAAANERTHLFVSLAYFMPVVGALLADGLFGRYRVILALSLVYCLGHLCLALFDQDIDGFSFGLLLLAIGAGGIKANVSAFVGSQFEGRLDGLGRSDLMTRAYGWFYFSINIGAVVSMASVPWLLEHLGPRVAFGVPGLFMLLATFVFWRGRRHYRHEPLPALRLKQRNWRQLAQDLRASLRVLLVFAFIPAFWALWDQSQSEWVLQAGKLDLGLLPGVTLLPAQVQLSNPVFVLLLIPLFSYRIYPFVRSLGLEPTPLRRIGAGLFMTALSFVVIAWLQGLIDAGHRPSVWWQILAYAILTVGEVMVYITGLEYAYTQAPVRLKSVLTAAWLLTVSIGNLVVSLINGSIVDGGFFAQFTGAAYYWLFVKIMLAVTLGFVLTTSWLARRDARRGAGPAGGPV